MSNTNDQETASTSKGADELTTTEQGQAEPAQAEQGASSTPAESFKDLFEQEASASPRARAWHPGDQVRGIVTQVTPNAVFVELDQKTQGYFEAQDIAGPDGKVSLLPGDAVDAYVAEVEASSGQIRLGRTLSRDAGKEQLARAYEAGMPVEGRVRSVNKGGVEVDVAGVRAFCPFAQLDRAFVADATPYIGQTLAFRVTEMNERGVVLSRRVLLEKEREAQREALVATLSVGSTVRGKVTQIRDFGAFVDIGGVEGLIPGRELSHDRARPEDIVSLGEVVEAQVTKIEREGSRLKITLSLKALALDPWDAIEAVAPLGQVVAGQVQKLADFGAFVRIAPGVEGLLHVSELGAGNEHPSKHLHVGQPVLVVVNSIDSERRRIALAPAPDGAEAGAVPTKQSLVVGQVVNAKVEKVERFGVFVQLEGTKGRAGRGLIPSAELGVARGADLRKEFPVGKAIVAKVIETGEGRLRLSIRAVTDDAERAEFDDFRQAKSPPKSMGTLGDLLKNKLK